MQGKQRVFVLLLLVGASRVCFAAATSVSVSGRQLLVSGQAFTVKGVSYSPTPVGSTLTGGGGGCIGGYQWWTDRPTYVADFPLIQRLGANTIRTYDLMNSASTRSQVLAALDEAQARGLYVIMGYYVQSSADVTNAGTRTSLRNEFLASVQAYKDHPAVLMWAVGNEQNLLSNGNNQPAWYTLLNLMAGDAKSVDSNHPVMSVEGECLTPDCTPANEMQIGDAALSANDASLTQLDIWGVNVYRGTSFGNFFSLLASSTSKPVLLTEFGKDAYRDSLNQESQALQASYLTSQWTEIAANLSASNPAKILTGGVVFEWTDEWWKDGGGTSCNAHNTTVLFTRPSDTTDPGYNDEWFGLASVSAIDAVSNPAGTARTLRSGYTSLQTFWNPSAVAATSGSASLLDGPVRNFPNPFRVGAENTTFVVILNTAAIVDIRIYDAGGQFVASLHRAAAGAGRVELRWDGRNRQGEQVSSALYIAKIQAKSADREEEQFRRVVAVK